MDKSQAGVINDWRWEAFASSVYCALTDRIRISLAAEK